MNTKKLPFSETEIFSIVDRIPTPFHIYDEQGIIETSHKLKQTMQKLYSYKQFYAVKACPNPAILALLKTEGFGVDCSTLSELVLAERVGFSGEDIMFTSNNTPAEEFLKARELGAIINLDDITHIDYLEKHAGIPDVICLRYNPGSLKKGNSIIGNPLEAKYGFTRQQLFEGLTLLKQKGVTRFGLHTMVASNELNPAYFVETAKIMFELVVEIKQKLGIIIEFVNLGGGFGIPYFPDQKELDIIWIADEIEELSQSILSPVNLEKVKIFTELGRYITGPHGYLVSRVQHIKRTYKSFAGLDSCMADLMRPALYGAYHHITVIGKSNSSPKEIYDVTGSLCENNDKFAINRELPELEQGDILVIHDTGAHGFAMGFNYNGKLRSAEYLWRMDKSLLCIRRAETLNDLFRTLDFSTVKHFTAKEELECV